MDADVKKPLIYRMLVPKGTWSLTELGLKKMALASLVLESVRWALQGRFPLLLDPSPGAPAWARILFAAGLLAWLLATLAAGGHIIDAIRLRDWKKLNLIGLALYLAWWIEVGLAEGHLLR
jgi:hypothetical protein